jgi:23S rRNA pseudouridine2605 synthase
MQIRLNRFLAQRGIASRRKADELIAQARVSVNGQVVEALGLKIDDAKDRVAVDGKRIPIERSFVYYMLNKPAGYLVTLSDPLQRPTIRRLMPKLEKGVFPVGRLDRDSEGLLLLTNDGELAFRLTHPRYEVKKKYLVRVAGEVTPSEISRLEKGIFLDDRKTAPAKIVAHEQTPHKSVLLVEVHEGRKREVRKMLEAVGHRVVGLKRVAFAGLQLEHLPSGTWRQLERLEVQHLKQIVGLVDHPDH